ncbi:hypothetical protein NSA56_11410 [Oceanobacillus caeni]|uniref:hypothetical protein n=1 Tax=Oceanobacillus caeni TaxID=405946 RepID=UPI00214A5520|nr:hypothetical protein [Oceanobacillus caeni]MCR1835003.1 hypothetical protein [Oceanobacillus caeni]
MEKEVTCKWLTDGKLAVIYQVGNLLLFYTTENDPKFKQGEMLSMERADESKPYKATRFSWNNVPNDAYMAFVW